MDDANPLQRPETPPPPLPKSDLLTVVESVYFQSVDRGPREIDSRWCRNLFSIGEQPYERFLKASSQWQPLDTGWVPEVGMLIIRNEEGGKGIITVALPDELLSKVIEVAYDVESKDSDSFLILPGESMRVHPKTAKRLCIRCPSGSARYQLFIIPK